MNRASEYTSAGLKRSSNRIQSNECEAVPVEQSEATMMHNRIAYQSARVNELTVILFQRLEHYMTDPYPTAEETCEKEGFASGYFRSLHSCSQPVNEAIDRLEEILRRLSL